jgi:hypothetical protein
MGYNDAEDIILKGLKGKKSLEKVDINNLIELFIKCFK